VQSSRRFPTRAARRRASESVDRGPAPRPGLLGPIAELELLHSTVDAACHPLTERHAERLICGDGCASCCVDGITVFRVEAALIRRDHAGLLECGVPRPPGACAFLDDRGSCRIYACRPYVCRTQGLPLRWFGEQGNDAGLVEYRDICPLNDDPHVALQDLDADDCWSIGPYEQRLAALQQVFGAGSMDRIALRSLFRNGNPR
jgi:hypothetical protein